MKNLSFTAILLSILLLSACRQQPRQEDGENEGILILDSIPENDEYDWTPERFKEAFHKWYNYRKAVGSRLRNGKFKQDYDAITYSNARTYLFHLKNRFNDIGMMSDFMSRVILENDCSNKELLEYSFEETYRRLYAEEVER